MPAVPPLEEIVKGFRSNYSKDRDRSPFRVIAAYGDSRDHYARDGSVDDVGDLDPRTDTVQIEAKGFDGETLIPKVLKDWWPGKPEWVTEKPVVDFPAVYSAGGELPEGVGHAYYVPIRKFDLEDCECLYNHYADSTVWCLKMDPPLDGHEWIIAKGKWPGQPGAPWGQIDFYPCRPVYADSEWVAMVPQEAFALTGTTTGTRDLPMALRFAGEHGYVFVNADLTVLPDMP